MNLALDLAGHVLTVQGEKGRTAALPYVDQAEVYDMLGRPMRSASADAGLSWALLAVDDRPIRTFREGPICVHAAYDALRRPTALKVQEGAGITATRTHEKLVYGEAAGAPSGAGTYHRGRVWKSWDGAGLVEVVAYDFKGHAIEVGRQLVALGDVDETIDWDATPGAGIAALETGETFTTEQGFDALDRVVMATTPDGSVTTYAYNQAGALETVDVQVRGSSTVTPFVESIDYDEKGRRTRIDYGNGTSTTHSYDPLTFRLTRLKTTRASDSAVLQDLRYVYDAVGNLVEVQDDAQQTVFFANAVVSPTQKYEYDALYRLTNAKGRQKRTMSGIPNHADPSKGGIPDGTTAPPGAMSTYERRYSYDRVGNLVEMKQVSAWTRTYAYAGDSNRLASTTEAGGTKSYRYTARGAMTSMAHLDLASTGLDDPMVSDFRDQLAHVTLNSGGDTVRFHYDPTRERVRKVWTKGSIVEERIYLGGWELWRKHGSSGVTDERETLHVLDGASRIAMVETLTVSAGSPVGSPSSVSRFQLGNHLGSACLELDADGELLTYEEFFPYGSTSWWAERSASPVSHKRYRYIGKEKDEETGLHYHSARYLAGWLGRWTSSDPAGLVDGVGRYSYVGGRPLSSSDPSGLTDPEVEWWTNSPFGGLSEFIWGGDAKRNEGPDGLGGLVRGLAGGLSGRTSEVLAESSPSYLSELGAELGEESTPYGGALNRLVTGQTINGQPADRAEAALDLGIQVGAALLGFAVSRIGARRAGRLPAQEALSPSPPVRPNSGPNPIRQTPSGPNTAGEASAAGRPASRGAANPIPGRPDLVEAEVADPNVVLQVERGELLDVLRAGQRHLESNVVIGKTIGLDDFAKSVGGSTYRDLKWGSRTGRWQDDFLNVLYDDGATLHVNLDGIEGGALRAVQRDATGRGTPMDWELSQIYQSPDRWGNIRWYESGKIVANPFR